MLTPAVEAEVVARIRSARPVVLIQNRPTPEFGEGKTGFGRDFAGEILRTVEADDECRFSTLADACSTPVGSGAFFIHGYVPAANR
jgi:hypothetical protein